MTAVVDQEYCTGCGLCVDVCPEQAISMSLNYTVAIDSGMCTGCGSCVDECPNEAISLDRRAVAEPKAVPDEILDTILPATSGSGRTGQQTK